jgi:flagellar FliL protein
MATAPKSNAKAAAADAAPPAKSNKTLFIILAVVLVLVLGGGAAAWFFMNSDKHHAEKVEVAPPPIFVTLEPLTVNLQRGEEGDQYLQTTLTAQFGEKEHEEMMKLYMPQIRSRLLLLLSSKKASEINTEEGKKKLTEEILATIRRPYSDKGPGQRIMNIHFTSFVIQ